jgi:hypothetical protein
MRSDRVDIEWYVTNTFYRHALVGRIVRFELPIARTDTEYIKFRGHILLKEKKLFVPEGSICHSLPRRSAESVDEDQFHSSYLQMKGGTADGGTVVKVLCYKSVGRWFDSRWCH